MFVSAHLIIVLSVASHINYIAARCLVNVVYITAVPLSGHDGVANDAESSLIQNYVFIASLKSETISKLINRIPGPCLLASSLPENAC